MRVIGTFEHENVARRFISFLKKQGIDATCDMSFEPASNQMHYTVWVHDEDQIVKAENFFKKFSENPNDSIYEIHSHTEALPIQEVAVRPAKNPLTSFLIAVCVFIFFINWPEAVIPRTGSALASKYYMTPVEEALLIDVPAPIYLMDELILKNPSAVSPEEVEQIANMPYWKGIYCWLLASFQGQSTENCMGPLFGKVREGEVWRLFTPCILHQDFLHILFNMIWLWILGRPIEQRIGVRKTLLLTLIAALGSNLVQYLVSGPLFLGYSGVITALAGFIWMREKRASWEGYPVHRTTLVFLAFFVLIFFALQLASFLLQTFSTVRFEAGIANSAHIAGALIGLLLGRLSFFKARPIR